MTNHNELENLLSAVTDALLVDERTNLDQIVNRYAVPRREVEGLVGLIRNLHVTLVGAQPSRRFVNRLRSDLVGTQRANIVARVRYLPPRVQIAAGIALVAGFMLLSRRRLIEDAHHDAQEIPVLQQQ